MKKRTQKLEARRQLGSDLLDLCIEPPNSGTPERSFKLLRVIETMDDLGLDCVVLQKQKVVALLYDNGGGPVLEWLELDQTYDL